MDAIFDSSKKATAETAGALRDALA
jgi:hypothetical protein